MPIEKVKGGYRRGKNGKIYPTREEAEKQAEAAYANGYTGDKLALDTVNVKMRRFDRDNRLHVEKTPISKAIINGYFGREIVGSQELGLEPEKEYKLLRDPEELKKAVPTFNNIPLLNTHIPVNAEKPHKEYVVGSTGSDGDFNDPYLNNSLVIWDGEAIDKVESGSKKELSAAYHYRADMTPGYYNGEYYDGVMRDIVGNHVALVEVGRAGADVYVSDEKPKEGKFIMSKMLEALRPHLSKDADLEKIEELIRQNTELDNERHNKIENKEEELLKGQQQIEKQHKNLSSDTEKEHKEIAKNEPGKKDGELKKQRKIQITTMTIKKLKKK